MIYHGVSSVQNGIYALGKIHMRSTVSLRSSHNVALPQAVVCCWVLMNISAQKTTVVCVGIVLWMDLKREF